MIKLTKDQPKFILSDKFKKTLIVTMIELSLKVSIHYLIKMQKFTQVNYFWKHKKLKTERLLHRSEITLRSCINERFNCESQSQYHCGDIKTMTKNLPTPVKMVKSKQRYNIKKNSIIKDLLSQS